MVPGNGSGETVLSEVESRPATGMPRLPGAYEKTALGLRDTPRSRREPETVAVCLMCEMNERDRIKPYDGPRLDSRPG